jgi:plastocyanin
VGRGLRLCASWAAVVAGVVLLLAPPASAAPFNPSPDSTWQTDGRVRSILYVGNTVYIAGEFTQVIPPGGGAGVARNHVAAFNLSSGQLLPWDPNADGIVWSLDVLNGTIYMGGEFQNVGGVARPYAAAVDATTGLVMPWNPQPDGNVNVVKVSPTGTLVLGGAFGKIGTKVRNSLAQVATDGTVLQWNPSVKQVSGSTCPPRCAPFVVSLAFSPDGQTLYFGGHFGLVGGVGRNNAAAVNFASGALLPWNPDVFGQGVGKNPNQANKVWHIELAPDRAFICGDYWSLDGFQRHPNLAAVDLTNGHLIPSFDATTDGNTPACLYRNGLLYIGGHFQFVGPNSAWVFQEGQKAELTGPGSIVRNHIAAVDATTGAVDAWNPSADSVLGLHTFSQSANQIAAGGDFTRIGARDQAHLGIFSLDTTPPDTLIDSKPAAIANSSTASFSFHSTENGSSFMCSVDGAAATACTSPVSLSGLADGQHGFAVTAIDPAGNPDPTPASYSWTIDTVAPGAPSGLTTTNVTSSRVDLGWTASPDADVVLYQVLRNGYLIGTSTTTSYADKSVAGPVTYGYSVVAVDRAGNASPATDTLNVDVPSPTQPPIFADGFESGDLSAWTSSTGLTVQSQEVFSGQQAARATVAGGAAFAQETLGTPLTELYYDLHFKVLNQNGNKITFGGFRTATNVAVLSLYTSSAGKLGYRNDKTGVQVASTTQVSTGSWHDLQAHLLVNGTSSEIEVWLDGVRVPDLARTESLGTAAIARVQLGDDATGKTYDVAYDQVSVASSFIVPPPPPGAPTGVAATPGNGQATVTWTAPGSSGGGPITGYSITVSPGGTVVRSSGLTTSAVVSGLTNGTSYTFTVTATNDYGTSAPSAASAPVIPATVPGPPQSVTATATDGMATITWSAPAADGGRPVTGYAVTSSPDGLVSVAGPSARSASVLGLTNGTTYTFTVTATNVMGTGPASAPSNAVTPQGNVTRTVTVSDSGYSPASTTAKQGDTIKWSFAGASAHSATDSTGLGLYDSGLLGSGSTYSYVFGVGGTFTVKDSASANTSTVNVPILVVPNAGTSATSFAVTWATAAAPAGYVFDVQVEKPGTTAFVSWQKGVGTANGLFGSSDPTWAGAGTYLFRSRIRNVASGAASGWSPSRSISVT